MAVQKMKKPLRIIFSGTPDFAAKHLDALIQSPHEIIAVFTQPDRPAGRGNKLATSPVKTLAKAHQISVFQPSTLKTPEIQQQIAALHADIMVVVAYGLILPEAVLILPKFGCINVHGSLLPRWRGAAPIQRACLAGDKKTGITIMQMDTDLDTGDILYQISCNIASDDTSASLYDKLAQLGPKALLKTLDDFSNHAVQPKKQDNARATYADKLSKQEAKLNWQLPAKQLSYAVSAFNPWPVSYFKIHGQPIKVWRAHALAKECNQLPGTIITADKRGIAIATSNGIFVITELQPAGKRIMSAQDLLNSKRTSFLPGKRLN